MALVIQQLLKQTSSREEEKETNKKTIRQLITAMQSIKLWS